VSPAYPNRFAINGLASFTSFSCRDAAGATVRVLCASYGRICLAVTQHLLASDQVAAASLLAGLTATPDLPRGDRTFIQALQTIVVDSRDRTFADAPDLSYMMAAEILFLLETLEGTR
jgi:hypothetical protein